jgi:hypothetical protein
MQVTATIHLNLTPDESRAIAKFLGLNYEFACVDAVQRWAREEIEQSLRELVRVHIAPK